MTCDCSAKMRRVPSVAAAAVLILALVGCQSVRPKRVHRPAPRAPVMLVHGFSGYRHLPVVGGYFHEVKERLEQEGATVFIPNLPPYSSSEARATFLAAAIADALRETGAKSVHLIAHSQGGIDSRYLIQDLKMGHQVASLTTISTPHNGTPVLELISQLPFFVTAPVFGSLGWAIDSIQGEDTGSVNVDGAFSAMTPVSMVAFNQNHPLDHDVPTFSIAGVTGPHQNGCEDGTWGLPHFWDAPDYRVVPTWLMVRGDPNHPRASDGVVPVDSAKFGTFLGCIPADHFDQMGNGMEIGASADAKVLDHLTFFADYVARLRSLEDTGNIASVTAPLPLPAL